ncbi:hypothetical protein CU097_008557 [Rhizopus azygosporus]|uniref:Uncharacterized protein n=1 Tax=Rhizopus azygosporus TaxID=86630 RepID=A0A367KCR1_RHIAZ|nr:hypothetical protein CU097_008557 [Rhizopus azygosporus]
MNAQSFRMLKICHALGGKPLEAMVALVHFLIEGKSALISMERRDEIVKEETNVVTFEELYFRAFEGLNRTEENHSKTSDRLPGQSHDNPQ